MTREEGIELVKKYQNVFPADIPIFLRWIGITEDELFEKINRFRDRSIWKPSDDIKWELLFSVDRAEINEERINQVRLKKKEECDFSLTPLRCPEITGENYTLIGKGFVNLN